MSNDTPKITPLLKRASMFLADGDFDNAWKYCERVLDIDPENGTAYLGKLMAEKRVRTRKDFANLPEPFDEDNNYQKFVRYGNAKLVSELKGYIAIIKDRNEKYRQQAEQERIEAERVAAEKRRRNTIYFATAAVTAAVIVAVIVFSWASFTNTRSRFIDICENGTEQEIIASISRIGQRRRYCADNYCT